MNNMSEKIALVTDTSCDLSQDIVDKYNIQLLPLKIIYPEKEYNDRFEISPEEVYKRFPNEIPTTSMASRADAAELFDSLRKQGYKKIIGVFISSGLSGTYGVIQSLVEDYPDMDIRIVDSKALSLGLGFVVIKAAEMIAENHSLEDIHEKLKTLPNNIGVFFCIPVLDYLQKGGRIGLVAATLGSIVDLKPIITINEEGKYYSYTKVRGRKKSISKMLSIVEEITADKNIKLAILHGGAEEEAQEIKKHFDNASNIKELTLGQISPVLVVHTGPGLVGLCYQVLD